jgi:hypothetical protein
MASDKYSFYAMEVGKAANSDNAKEVRITMPVGGMGFFRFPRVGEYVLIDQASSTITSDGATVESSEWVLLAFYPVSTDKPSNNTPFYPANSASNDDDTTRKKTGYNAGQTNPGDLTEFIQDNGMALRYKVEDNANKPNEKTVGDEWSEIGFYNKKAKWPDSVKTFDKTDKNERLDSSAFSRQDTLNIKSAGDIESRAANYHLIKAKRFELLANADELSPESRGDNGGDCWRHWEADKAPVGDNPLDDPAVHTGDVHVRAGRNVVIKAEGEIRLQVGRTTLIIDDSGFTVTSRKIASNAVTSEDTSLSLKARGGISMFGENVGIASSLKFSMSDMWGSNITGMLGNLTVAGIQINQKTYGAAEMKYAELINSLMTAQNISVASMAASSSHLAYAEGWIDYALNSLKTILNDGKAIYDLHDSYKKLVDDKNKLDRIKNEIVEAYKKELEAAIRAKIRTANSENRNQILAETEPLQKDLNMDNDVLLNTGRVAASLGNVTDALDAAASLIGTEPIETATAVLNMVLALTATAYTEAEKGFAYEVTEDTKGGIEGKPKYWTPKKKKEFRNMLNLCAMSIDSGIIDIFLGYISLGIGTGGPASIRLRNSGDIVIKAGSNKNLYATLSDRVSVPVPIATEKTQWGIKCVAAVSKSLADAANITLEGIERSRSIPSYTENL